MTARAADQTSSPKARMPPSSRGRGEAETRTSHPRRRQSKRHRFDARLLIQLRTLLLRNSQDAVIVRHAAHKRDSSPSAILLLGRRHLTGAGSFFRSDKSR